MDGRNELAICCIGAVVRQLYSMRDVCHKLGNTRAKPADFPIPLLPGVVLVRGKTMNDTLDNTLHLHIDINVIKALMWKRFL